MRYAAAAASHLAKADAKVVYAGRLAELLICDQDWDMLILVEYPTRRAFLDMVGSPAYQAIEHLRHDALERSVLYASDPLLL